MAIELNEFFEMLMDAALNEFQKSDLGIETIS